jgi:hypothetical protein
LARLDAIQLGIQELKSQGDACSPVLMQDSEIEAVLTALRPYAGQQIHITIPLGDCAAESTAEQFIQVFGRAGWVGAYGGGAIGITRVVFAGGAPTGISIGISASDDRAGTVSRAAIDLLEQLRSRSVSVGFVYTDRLRSGELGLTVGRRAPVVPRAYRVGGQP